MTGISTHVLDTTTGRPAAGLGVTLEVKRGEQWEMLGSGTTNDDGRIAALTRPAGSGPGRHRLRFDTGTYLGDGAFFPEVTVTFEVTNEAHLHVPLLLSRFGYSVYRGS